MISYSFHQHLVHLTISEDPDRVLHQADPGLEEDDQARIVILRCRLHTNEHLTQVLVDLLMLTVVDSVVETVDAGDW